MYAIIRSGGKQYRVHPGQTIEVEKLAVEPGQTLDFPEVLLVAGDDSVSVGAPLVQGAKVTATVLSQTRTPKVTVFKYKPKVRYRRKVGHRQSLTRLRIDSISV